MNKTVKSAGIVSDYTTEQKIVFLYELQQVKSKIDQINFIKGELPEEVRDLTDEVEGLQTRIANINSKVEELNKSTRAAKESIENAKVLIKKYAEQQNNVRNNREYESISKEIEYQELEIELCEKHIKEFSAESKEKKSSVEAVKERLADREHALKEKKEELEVIDAETSVEIAELTETANNIAQKIDSRLLTAFDNIRGSMKNGLAVVTVKRDACGGCFNRIPAQRQLDIRMSKKIIVCEYCGRILISDLMEEEQ